ncbi:MAG: uroporphyrinogen decarboxylase family protein [Anaerolineae bacterium]
MPSTMTHWQRIRAAIAGQPTDRPPISLWRHWANADETALGLAYSTLFWQREYDFDLVKVTPASGYMHEDWGTESTYIPNTHGTRTTLRRAVASPEAWSRLPVLDPHKGCLGRQVEAIRIVAEELEDTVPILQTIFSPLTTAWKLAGDRMFSDLRRHPDLLRKGLRVIAETTANLAVASAEAGATGMFFATQCDTYRLMTEEQYREFGETYDRIVLDAVRDQVEIIMMHAHGEDIMFDLLASYPIDAINWHDRMAGPSLAEARKRFPDMLVGGISEWTTLLEGPSEAIRAEIEEAVAQTGGRAHMVGAGCVVPITAPHVHIRAARDAVEIIGLP